MSGPERPAARPVSVSIRVRPGASRTKVGGGYGDGPDRALVVSVTARAVDGAATAAVLVAVAEAFGLRKTQVTLVRGATSRTKVVALHGVPEPQIAARLHHLRDGAGAVGGAPGT